MVFIHAPCDPYDGSSRILVPVRRAKSGKCRHHIAAIGIFYFLRHILRVRRRVNQAQFIPEPLDCRSRNEYGAFQRIIYLAIQPPGNGGYQAVIREHRLLPGIHQQEAARSICILCLPCLKAGLSEQGRLLVAGCPGDWNRTAEVRRVRLPVDAAGLLHLGQHRGRNIQQLQNLLIPLQSIYIKEQRP